MADDRFAEFLKERKIKQDLTENVDSQDEYEKRIHDLYGEVKDWIAPYNFEVITTYFSKDSKLPNLQIRVDEDAYFTITPRHQNYLPGTLIQVDVKFYEGYQYKKEQELNFERRAGWYFPNFMNPNEIDNSLTEDSFKDFIMENLK